VFDQRWDLFALFVRAPLARLATRGASKARGFADGFVFGSA
jgi:hypothetical protein